MKILFFFISLLAMNLAQGQTYGSKESGTDSNIIYGSRVDADIWIAIQMIPRMIASPKKNWPLYGYAIPNDSENDPCDKLRKHKFREHVLNLPIGKVSVASLETDRSDVSYIGFPIGDTVSTESETGSPEEYTTFHVRDVCRWFDDPEQEQLKNIKDKLITRMEWSDGTSSRPWFLLVEKPLPTAADIRVATHPRPRQMAVVD